jgi:glycosyltransferase involved in cell wall biosynthesis
MDAFCALSREESFGVAIVEALAAGLPVVVSDAPGPQEIVGGTGAGFVVRREAVEEAAVAMGRLLAEEVWAGCAEAAAPAARRRYHWPDQVAAQIQAYRALAPG